MGHVILHSLKETAGLLPFLFLTYLLMEILERRARGVAERWLQASGRVGPLMGGVLGLVPMCGFSAAASGLYAGRILTTGTLVAVYLSTSDEMLPILISERAPLSTVLTVLGLKLGIGVAVGFMVDLVTRLVQRKEEKEQTPQIEGLCARARCRCEDLKAVLSAIKHTAEIALFILLVTFLINTLLHFVGEEAIASVVQGHPLLGTLLASFVGLIPNCASSVALTQLFLRGVIGMGPLMAGLFVNAGVGLVVLFKINRPVWDSFRILGILWGTGLAAGLLVGLFF